MDSQRKEQKSPLNFIKSLQDRIPARAIIAIMMFMACCIAYMLRVNLSINIIAMVQPKDNSTAPDFGPRYTWTTQDEGWLLGTFFYGYILSNLPAGFLAEKYGGRAVVGYALAASAIFTALAPISASCGLIVLCISRFLLGACCGVTYPGFHYLISNWAPPAEKGLFIAALGGGSFGNVISWQMCGVIIERIGWVWAFYVPAILGAMVAIIWFVLVYNDPDEHPRITAEEKEYIQNSLIGVAKKRKLFPPLVPLLLSLPFWALLILQFGNLWGLYFLQTAAPKYMSQILKFDLSKTGFLSSLPTLSRMITGFLFGALGDYIRRKQWISVTAVRKSFCLFSHVIPGLLLVSLGFISEPYVCVALLTLSLAFNGASSITNLQNNQDLAPNYAGSIYGIITCIGTTSGFISPIIVSEFTKDRNTSKEWTYIFFIGAAAYIVPAVLFAIFGSGQVQKWNDQKKDDDS